MIVLLNQFAILYPHFVQVRVLTKFGEGNKNEFDDYDQLQPERQHSKINPVTAVDTFGMVL